MTRAELSDLFTPIYDEFFQIGYNSVKSKHQMVADVVINTTKDFLTNNISGMGLFDEADEDSNTGLDHLIIGYEDSFTPKKYRKYFYVTFEANDQMEYAQLKKSTMSISVLGKGAMATQEKVVADILNDGFSTACNDGLYLFYAAHYKNPEETGTTYDNLLAGAFSHDALEAAEKKISSEFYDMDGMPMAIYAGRPTIVFPPALRGAVGRVLDERAGERPGVTTRDINVYSGKYDLVEWDFLSAQMGGSDTAWFIIYPELKNLKLIKHKAGFETATWVQNEYQRYYFDAWLYAVAGAADWRGLFGSTGL